LYGLAKERAALTCKELLLDLYCGIGSIGLSMADQAGEVLGMEIVERAAQSATENAERNGITNAAFFCGDASDPQGLLKKAAEERGSLTHAVVVLDPPRKGTTPELIEGIAAHGVPSVVYVSCNPDTLARDCAIFAQYGYEIGTVTPVDLFPRTGHVESVVCLTRRLDNELRERMN
jgi:23S rRNA (uracil1939-C5)-methyltransferase